MSEPIDPWVPAGHFYSPIPDPQTIARRADRIFDRQLRDLPGIDLAREEQIAYGAKLFAAYRDDYFPEHSAPPRRYYWRNDYFPFGDAFYTDRFVRTVGPRRIVEVGSGFSSAVMLDACDDLAAEGNPVPQLEFIEPNPERLQSLLRPTDFERVTLREQEVQDVPIEVFESLADSDLLFIDSSHVAKTGSDLCFLLFEVLPRLAPGVFVFVHDVPWPFEYPRHWVEEGRAWNEAYLLRAFLQFNSAFAVRWYPDMATRIEFDEAKARAPHLAEQGASGIWLQRRHDSA